MIWRWHIKSHIATHCKTLQRTATHCITLQCTVTHCNALQYTNASRDITMTYHATHCNILQHTATHRNTPQHTSTHCNTLTYHVICQAQYHIHVWLDMPHVTWHIHTCLQTCTSEPRCQTIFRMVSSCANTVFYFRHVLNAKRIARRVIWPTSIARLLTLSADE